MLGPWDGPGVEPEVINPDGIDHPTRVLLEGSLAASVPAWIEVLKDFELPWILARAQVLAGRLAERGDIILFRSKKKGATADALNVLAEGLACLAFMPGGVRFLGMHFSAGSR